MYVHRGCLFKALTLRAPGRLTHHPFFVIGSLYYSTSGINAYSSRKLYTRYIGSQLRRNEFESGGGTGLEPSAEINFW